MIWAGGRTTPPLDKPKCGWENELCVEQEKKGKTDEIAIIRNLRTEKGTGPSKLSQRRLGLLLGTGKKRPIERRSDVTLPWYQNFWIITIGSFGNDKGDGDGNENGKKTMGLYKRNNFARASRFFVHFLEIVHDCEMKLPHFTRPLYGVGEQNTKISLDVVLSDSTPGNFANSCQIKV